MVTKYELLNWYNGNYSDLDKNSLIEIASYFETIANGGYVEIEDDVEDD